ncbi:alpha-tocopherol transfer protein-like [Folsomia candida]|uniref:Alpha-tocopherol transfer protein-like n=1 Tax=Folsomia candida TaxID=158441 RepID=A0A226CV57_FOLCA|nr:alpha-tocopherol transfer protein-like [Folsomia candida]OXA37285.1 Alpha-tocopherol transfer protein-like [Folsomia candida]
MLKSEKNSLESLRHESKRLMGETEEVIPEKIKQLKKILQKDKELVPHPSTFDEFYLRCIRAKKYDVDRAANLYRKFCRLRTGGGGDFLGKLKPSNYRDILTKNFCSTLKTRDDLGRQVIIVRVEKWVPSEIHFDVTILCMFLLLDEISSVEDTQLFGAILIADLSTLGVEHAKQISPWRIHTMVKVIQDSYPLRIKEFHVVRNPKIFGTLYALAKPFLKEKMKKRINFHGDDINTFLSSVRIDSTKLPEFLGGSLSEEEYSDKSVPKRILKKDAYYDDLLKYGYVPKPS